MMLGRCPVCHSQISLEAVCQDEAGRDLLGILANLPGEASRALVQYLGLFRPEKRDLSNDRALRLAREVLALCTDSLRLSAAMAETVEAIRGKCGAVPMKSHNYLRRVLEGMPETGGALVVAGGVTGAVADPLAGRLHREAKGRAAAPSATMNALAELEDLKRRARGQA
jgi:hypothetical protein